MRLARPSSALLARCLVSSASSKSSILRSISSVSLKPSGPNSLMPLSLNGLCDAEIITPRSARMERVSIPTAGVGIGPVSRTSMPTDVKPATKDESRRLPDLESELRRNGAVGPAANAVGPEILAHHYTSPCVERAPFRLKERPIQGQWRPRSLRILKQYKRTCPAGPALQ